MPEGDTIAWHARRIRAVLEGFLPDAIVTPHPRFARDRWPERLASRAVTRVDTHGKHLFVRFEGDLVIHSHLRMTGSWDVYGAPAARRRPPRRTWLVIGRGDREVVQLNGPVLELMTASRVRFDQRLAGLGPDVLADRLDAGRFLRRLREDDPTRSLGDALIDQRNLAGIGNIWKSEGCWEAALDPWRAVRSLSDAEVLKVIELVRPRMFESAREGPRVIRARVYGRAGQPCPRCGTRVQARTQGDQGRTTYWCPGCQR